MIKILRKYNKKILAVIGVFLMIAFIVPTVAKNAMRQGGDATFGRLGDGTRIIGHEYYQAAAEWETLTQRLVVPGMFGMGQSLPEATLQGMLMPAASSREQELVAMEQSLEAARRVVNHITPMHYLLLTREAQRMGITISEEEVDRVYQDIGARMIGRDPQLAKIAIAHWLSVIAAFERVAKAADVSEAVAFRQLADEGQQIALALVEFAAEHFKKEVPQPKPEQLEEFFRNYQQTDPQNDESGFGYRFPNRVKIQYICVPFEKVKESVSEEEVYRYYKEHQDQYQTTQPSTAPSTSPVASTLPSTQPTTKPWASLTAEDKKQIRERIAGQRAGAIAKIMQLKFSADWPVYRQAMRDGKEPPESTLNVPYSSYMYLKKMQDMVQQHKDAKGVLPETADDPSLLSQKELADLPRIGEARLQFGARMFMRPSMAFADYAIRFAQPFMTEGAIRAAVESGVQPLALYQPSAPLEDAAHNIYIFRISGAEKAHPAPNLAAVEKRVHDDYITLKAYELARTAAANFLGEAVKDGIAAAAKGDKHQLITTPLFSHDPRRLPAKPKVADTSRRRFADDAFKLLYERLRTGKPGPVGTINLPRMATVFVAQLVDAKPATESQFTSMMVSALQRRERMVRVATMVPGWFNPESIDARMGYKAEQPMRGRGSGPEGGEAPPPPIPGM